MKNFYQKNRRDILCFGILFAVLVLRISWFGFSYHLQLDDYIHYRTYPAGTDPVQLCIDNGLFTSRPLAALMDIIFWGRLPLFFGSVLLCAMYAGAGILFWRLFRRLFGTDLLFLAVFALLPLGFEGTYWHAAATRILPPMLFTALAVTAFDRFVQTKGYLHLLPFLLWTLLSFCFYEQMLVLSLALSLMLTLLYLLDRKWHAAWGLTVLIPVGIYVAVTGYFSSLAAGQLADRMNTVFPWDPTYFTDHLPKLAKQLRECFVDGGWLTMSRGFLRGIELIFANGVWAAVLIPAAAAGIFFLGRKLPQEGSGRHGWLCALFALLAALAPVTPFFVIAKPWLCLRNTVPSFLGLALLIDWLARLVLRNRTALVTALVAAVCLTASVSELYDYYTVATTNEQVAKIILAADQELDLSGRVGILGLNQNYTEEQNYLYHDHVVSAHASDWALTGLVRYYHPDCAISFTPTPLSVDDEHYWYSWSRDTKKLDRFTAVLLYDHESGSIEELVVEPLAELEWMLYNTQGEQVAHIWQDEKGFGNVEFFETDTD